MYLFPGQWTGRPRERLYVTDYPASAVIDANELRRDAKKRGQDLSAPPSIRVKWLDRGRQEHETSLEIIVYSHPVYRYRWWLSCPRCGETLRLLYASKSGPGCRKCLKLRYPR